ncbi:MAG: endolytic transglycosylase MltG [Erysipelotrichaceae bacterium]|nr:endolytic transglycosylase MltG [Erysipelotrichaceae bacterium]
MKKKQTGSKHLGFKLFLCLILIAVIGLFSAFMIYHNQLKAVSDDNTEIIFEVNKGETLNTVLPRLENEGLINSALFAKLYVKLNDSGSLAAGKFSLNAAMDTAEVIATITDSTQLIHDDITITFIEGEWLKHMSEKFEQELGIQSDELMSLWNDEQYIRSLMDRYPFLTEEIFNEDSRYYLEGYLMPNTYAFAKGSDAKTVTEKMLDQTLKVYNKFKDTMNAHELSVHELFTLASIVQYEASKIEDMKMIAGVFYNRMDIGMRLQSSVTVCYAIDIEKSDSWKSCEVNPTYNSPYNTYMVEGLPPGPILNPGVDAIEAVLNPTESNYYYFMADVYGDGTVYFAETYAEHLALVNKYLK